MNKAKARDFFSDYYEGSIDPSLKQVFEKALENDASLKADYREFTKLMSNLNDLADVPVPEPAFLSERIASRIDARLKEQAAPDKGFWWMNWGRWAFAGAAAVAVLTLFVASTSNKGSFAAGFLPGFESKAEVGGRLTMTPKGLVVESRTKEESTVTFTVEGTGEVLTTIKLDSWQPLAAPLTNDDKAAEVVLVQFSDGQSSLRVALPGTELSPARKGSGTLDDLAKALANTFGKPVHIEATNPKRPVVWEFEEGEAVDAVVTTLRKMGLTLEERSDGILFLN